MPNETHQGSSPSFAALLVQNINDIQVQDPENDLETDLDQAVTAMEAILAGDGDALRDITSREKGLALAKHIFACGYVRGAAEAQDSLISDLVDYVIESGHRKDVDRP